MIRRLQRWGKVFIKDADIYITILIGIALTFFGMINGIVGLSPVQIVQSGLLAMLVLLPSIMLKNRRTDKSIETTLRRMTKSFPSKIQV